MAAWHRSRRADVGLRATGLLLGSLSYVAFARLFALHPVSPSAGILAYGLAMIGFMAGSSGSALALLGHHLFDEVEVGTRWQHRAVASHFPQSETIPAMDMPEPVMLVVGRDVDGDWTVSDSVGGVLGRFASAQAAQRFAEAERRGRSSVTVATSAGSPRRIDGRLSLGSAGQASRVGTARA